jgi:hypothetical protein
MKSQSALTIVFLFVIASRAFAVSGDFIVASNLLDDQTRSSAAEEVGKIAPPYSNNGKVGQSFTPLSSGTLTSIVAMVTHGRQSLSATPPLDVSVYSSASGIPVTQLAKLSFPAADFSSFTAFGDRRKTFDFSQFHIPLDRNREYMVTFGTPFGINAQNGLDSPFLIDWSPASAAWNDHSLSLGRNLSLASDGISWQVVNTSYRELGIVVLAIPEPSTFMLSVIAFTTLPTRRRKTFPPQSRGTSSAIC